MDNSNSTNKPLSDRSLTDWIRGSSSSNESQQQSKDAAADAEESDIVQHRKQLAQILRYIATMHHSLGGGSSAAAAENTNGTTTASAKRGSSYNGHSFVRKARNNVKAYWQSAFYQGMSSMGADERFGVLLSTHNFRRLLGFQADSSTDLFQSPPFSFYAATAGLQSPKLAADNRKRAWASAFKNPLTSSFRSSNSNNNNGMDGKACWLRLTRLTSSDIPEPPSIASAAVRRYLQQWKDKNAQEFRDCESLRDILTLETLAKAPKIAPTADSGQAKEIKAFLRNYQTYLRKRAFQQALEPMYNQLFEWVQQTQHHDELVWGLGHARMMTSDQTIINGPLLEVLMEVELARDGALLVRPREHSGVALNREIVSALMSSDEGSSIASGSSSSSQHQRLTALHRAVAELDPLQMAPGQPATYIPFLKRMTVELSSRGIFQTSANVSRDLPTHYKMLVTEAWCLYSRPKPSSVWARDAMTFADRLLLPPNSNGDMELPEATWALTHGPSKLDDNASEKLAKDSSKGSSSTGSFLSRLFTRYPFESTASPQNLEKEAPLLFPLPSSESQNRIADLLIRQAYPAVVAEGPPGTGKTHTIANMISAYLCRGKRVLVTSKSAPALSVVRARLPRIIQELCVDVSMSELAGMRQLQKTVERLANRVSGASVQVETEKVELLLRNIDALEKERAEIDAKLDAQNDRKRTLVQKPDGQKLMFGLMALCEKAPWLVASIASWNEKDLLLFRDQLVSLISERDGSMERVFLGCPSPPSDELLSVVAAKAGVTLSSIKQASKKMFASLPLLGAAFGQKAALVEEQLALISLDGKSPETTEDWKNILHVLKYELAIETFHQEKLRGLVQEEGWPENKVYQRIGALRQLRIINSDLIEMVTQFLRLKEIAKILGVPKEIQLAAECYALDERRSLITSQIQRLAEDLVDAKVVAELSRTFSTEAQSALIRFSQIAGKAKFSRSSQASKMTARQRRHRQEYLDAFDRCVRYIPTWIMTSSQISDYLPAECLFDLVVIDEASQSDITVLPGMLRGKQWLIVGDGKQVSPTESFISEDSIESLRAALPRSPLEDSLLPGQSFFDLCAQAYPRGRVVLSEHFRSAPEIISFSNHQFYDGRLTPLRLPTSSERLSPSLMDIRIPGVKTGKVNEKECDEIVKLIHQFVNDAASLSSSTPRSIGVISLLGDDQSRLIRGRLLDSIGPQKFKEHDILIGDPPTFQGAERDIVFLSMVCSPGSVPTQNRLMHAQRMNVALSRARDRMVLVRSIDAQHIPNMEDIKLPVIEFFEEATHRGADDENILNSDNSASDASAEGNFRAQAQELLKNVLKNRGFSVATMGIVWSNAICVEHPRSTARAALCIENGGETKEEWARLVTQQKCIERVGWKCFRVDALSLLADYNTTVKNVIAFLSTAGVEEPAIMYDTLDSEDDDGPGEASQAQDAIMVDNNDDQVDGHAGGHPMEAGVEDAPHTEVVVISSDDESPQINTRFPDMAKSSSLEEIVDDKFDASDFGEVVALDFILAAGAKSDTTDGSPQDEDDAETDEAPRRKAIIPVAALRRKRRNNPALGDSMSTKSGIGEAYLGDQSDSEEEKVEYDEGPARVRGSGARDAAAVVVNIDDDDEKLQNSLDNVIDVDDMEPGLDKMDDVGVRDDEDGFSSEEGSTRSKRRRSYYRRLDKYSRDGRWYPGRAMKEEEDEQQLMYDTDSDLAPTERNSAAEENSADDDEDFKLSAQDEEEEDD